jgi:hypothetical protein
VVSVDGDHNDEQVGQLRLEPRGRFDTRDARQMNIHQDDLGLKGSDFG